MNPKHSNPTRPRRDKSGPVWARAPYNFVPLPEKMVTARPPLDHDTYDAEALTGWIECELETCSPTYVRGLMTEVQFRTTGQKKPDELTEEEKIARAPFYGPSGEEVEGYAAPVIPGSTLRGMVRNLVEIAGFGRPRWVADEPTFTFRAVAAARDDPLRAPYEDMLGRYGADVKAGFLVRQGDDWYIAPAGKPESVGLRAEKGSYFKVKERNIPADAIPGFVRLDSPRYRPGYFSVSFEAQERQGKRGRYVAITRIGAPDTYQHRGVLVCSGNMLETKEAGSTPRKNHALLLPKDPKARSIKIREQTIRDYLAGLTTFQKKELWGGGNGCLEDGGPVFYVERDGEVIAFGHSPHFRVPAQLPGEKRAATPRDFVPPELRDTSLSDLADAIFGWVEDESSPKGQRAGRVSFGDARMVGTSGHVWLSPEPITPHVLAGPKPTTFQHYLVQDREARHDPDEKASLAHYGTSPLETQLRGHKLYWHKGDKPDIAASPSELKHESQLTRMVPLAPGVQFKFTLRFENLRPEELGALLWALSLPGEKGKVYRHKLGMGKPLGMGSVALKATLRLADRPARHARLFAGDRWAEAVSEANGEPYVQQFERYVLRALASDAQHLREVERIQMLLAMLEWREGDEAWLETTRYMEIEYGPNKVNEYKERPVLPDPLAVAGQPVQLPTPVREQRHQPAGTQPAGATKTGVVKQWLDERGVGWITQDDGSEIRVHHSGIVGSGRKSLRVGQRVSYTIGSYQGRPQAENVHVVKD